MITIVKKANKTEIVAIKRQLGIRYSYNSCYVRDVVCIVVGCVFVCSNDCCLSLFYYLNYCLFYRLFYVCFIVCFIVYLTVFVCTPSVWKEMSYFGQRSKLKSFLTLSCMKLTSVPFHQCPIPLPSHCAIIIKKLHKVSTTNTKLLIFA